MISRIRGRWLEETTLCIPLQAEETCDERPRTTIFTHRAACAKPLAYDKPRRVAASVRWGQKLIKPIFSLVRAAPPPRGRRSRRGGTAERHGAVGGGGEVGRGPIPRIGPAPATGPRASSHRPHR